MLAGNDDGVQPLVFFTVALGIRYLVIDHGLAEAYADLYHRAGRFVIALGVLAGGVVGASTRLSDTELALILGFIGGAVIPKALRHELPDGSGNFAFFAGGALAYSALLLTF